MKIVDANVLLYAVNRQSVQHGATVVTFDRDFERFGVRVQLPT